MHFADLGAGEYTYQLTAAAENKGETVETVLIDKFTLHVEGAQNSTQTETAQPETPLHLRAECGTGRVQRKEGIRSADDI